MFSETVTYLITLLPLWTVSLGNSPESGYSSPLITEHRIYITGNENDLHTIFCFDLDGQFVWKYQSGQGWTDLFPGTRSTPIIDLIDLIDKVPNLYDESPLGKLVCLNAQSGKLVWQRNLLDDYETPNLLYGRSGSLLIDEQKLFTQLGGNKGSILCLDKTTGQTLWLAPSTGHPAGYGTPVLFRSNGRKLIAAMDAKGIFVVDRQNVQLLFHVRHPARLDENITTPIYHNNQLFIYNGAGSDSKLLKLFLDGETIRVKELWTNHLLANTHGGVKLLDGQLYGATNKRGGGIACICFENGADRFLDRKITRGSFDVVDGVFYILTEFGEVVVAKPNEKAFTILTRLQLPDAEDGQAYAHPVVHNNRLYVRINETLHCIEIRKSVVSSQLSVVSSDPAMK
ncbi:MAG: PQQ-like beta-propeller repeat protein [Planctomycetaceae bacterium]|jgi:outer membrane protein assembly factor BamB|nr:PQQ-like beta-propeller repeat protein [Planctomycetaceae bacterium]